MTTFSGARRLFARCFTSARLVSPLSSGLIRLDLPPLRLPESASLIYRECFIRNCGGHGIVSSKARCSFATLRVLVRSSKRPAVHSGSRLGWRIRFEYRSEALVSVMHNGEHSMSVHAALLHRYIAKDRAYASERLIAVAVGLVLANKLPR